MADVKIRIDTIKKMNTIEEDELELSLSLRPLNGSSSSSSSQQQQQQQPKNNVLETSSPVPNGQIVTKRDAQAIRRHEAKLKRNSKRQNPASFPKNDVVADHREDSVERRRKFPNLGFQEAAPLWLGWNAGGFAPYQGQNGNYGSRNEGKDGAISSGSSSGISDNYQSFSGPGGNSSDTGSHSSHPHLQLQSRSSQLELDPNNSNPSHSKPQLCSSYSNMPELVSGSSSSKSREGATSFNTTNCTQSEARANNDKPLSDNNPNTTPRSSSPKEAKGEIGKPPKPVGLTSQQKLTFAQMPCVSTTGNGPNGKTITGFLYKYTEAAQVSIVCVCHGTSFSPAGFVEHAGGVDIEYPLRHIKVYM
ncbi:Ninja-family protein AFP3 [Bienertia sinuspersici]